MQKIFKYIFLIDFIFSSLLIIVFGIYVLNRINNAAGHPFDGSYINHLPKVVAIAIISVGIIGAMIGLYTIKTLKNNKSCAKKIVIIISFLSICALSFAFLFIKHIEGRYIYRSNYFKFYLIVGIPILITSLLALFSFIKSSSAKQNLSN